MVRQRAKRSKYSQIHTDMRFKIQSDTLDTVRYELLAKMRMCMYPGQNYRHIHAHMHLPSAMHMCMYVHICILHTGKYALDTAPM